MRCRGTAPSESFSSSSSHIIILAMVLRSSRLPIEVYERAIGLLSDEDPSLDNLYHHTLKSCALTCRDLLPRSRTVLYGNIVLRDPNTLALFMRTLAGEPWLGSLVRKLQVLYHAYLPFAHRDMLANLPNMHSLFLIGAPLWKGYPSWYLAIIARFPIRELCLSGCSLSLARAIPFIWSLPELRVLYLLSSFKQEHDPPEIQAAANAQLLAMPCRRWRSGCNRLTHFHLDVSHRPSSRVIPR